MKYKQYLSQYWRPDEMLMINHQTGKSTPSDLEKLPVPQGPQRDRLHDEQPEAGALAAVGWLVSTEAEF